MELYVPWLLVVVLAAALIYVLRGRRGGGPPAAENGAKVVRAKIGKSGRATVPWREGDVVIWQLVDPKDTTISFEINVKDPQTGGTIPERITLTEANPEQCCQPCGGPQSITVTIFDTIADNTTTCRGCVNLGGGP